MTGVGGTTLMKCFHKEFRGLPYRFVSGGALMRARQKDLGFETIEEFSAYNAMHPEDGHDMWCDKTIATFGLHDMVVCESRLSHVFMPYAFKILLVCPLHIRARRRAGKKRDLGKTMLDMFIRDVNDTSRYADLYPGCLWPESDFDIVLDTSVWKPRQILKRIMLHHREWVEMLKSKAMIENISVSK